MLSTAAISHNMTSILKSVVSCVSEEARVFALNVSGHVMGRIREWEMANDTSGRCSAL